MTEILSTWRDLDGRRKIVIVLAAVAALVAMISIARLANRPDMALLYAGLDAAAAGEVIGALEQQAVPFEVRGGAIYVASAVRDQTRLTLAGQGLPATSGVGYELLDTMTGFGTTSQMFDAAYWRAREGELARTILASRDIRSARVHIANPVNQPFARNVSTSASVTVTMARGALDDSRAQAIRFLVASAVSGLAPGDVAVIDSENGMILAAGTEDGATSAADATTSRAEALRTNIERLLAARVGPGRAVVEVMIDADMDSQTITERIVDPTSRVTVSSDAEETAESQQGSDSGAVTVASNLPDGDAGAAGANSSSTTTKTRERLNYEVSETRRERVIQPGQIRRISVAVIVDGLTEVTADGTRNWIPRPEEELGALRSLVESAIGFDPARGDVVTLQTLEFPQVDNPGTLVTADGGPFLSGDLMRLIQSGVLGAVALALGLFVIRPILTQRPVPAITSDLEREVEILDNSAPLPARFNAAESAIEHPDRAKIGNLRAVISDRTNESADVLRRWIETSEKDGERA